MKRSADHKHRPPKDFTGVADAAHLDAEAPHKPLARGALAKAAEAYKTGEIQPHEFDRHVKRAHGRLQEPMGMPMMAQAVVVKSKAKRKRHKVD